MKKRFLYWFTLLVLDILAALFLPKIFVLNRAFFWIVGALFIIYGIILNSIAGRTLKLYAHRQKVAGFSVPDRFTNAGIYSCMRHPGQFGNLLLLLGIALASGKVLAILFAGWLIFFGLGFILFVEEREALQKFGQVYCDYMQKTPPFAFGCLQRGLQAIVKRR